MGATLQQKQQNLKIPANLNLDPQLSLSHATITEQRQNTVIFEIPFNRKSIGIGINRNRSVSGNNPIGNVNKSRIGLDCTIKKSRIEPKETSRKFIMKKINATTENQYNLRKALDNLEVISSRDSKKDSGELCKLVGHEKNYDGFMCGSHSSVSLVFEYWGDYTMAKEIELRSSELISKTRRIRDEDSIEEMLSNGFQISQLIRTAKFLLEVCQAIHNPSNSQSFPKISLSDLILLEPSNPSHSPLKYRHPLDSLYCNHSETLQKFMSISEFNLNEMGELIQSQMLANIAVCIMSMCLLEDCYLTCFNFMGEICVSVVEKKIQYIYELYERKNEEKIARQLCKMLETFIFQGKSSQKLALNQGKTLCNKISAQHHKQLIKNHLQSSSINIQQWDLMDANEKNSISQKEEETSASMDIKLRKIEIFSKPTPSKRVNIENSCRIVREERGQHNLSASRNMSVEGKKDWKIEKSSERKIQINQTLKARTTQWVVQREEIRETKVKIVDHFHHKCNEIDKKWSEDEQLFKNMPQFQRFSSQTLSFHFNTKDLEPIHNPKVSHVLLK